MLQLYSAPPPNKDPVHKTMQAYMYTLHARQRESKLTTTMLQYIPTFDGQGSSKVEDWFMDIETTTDILTEIYTHLAEANLHSLTHTPIHKATQTVECWDEIKGILRLKLCNVNIHTYTSHFMEIQQNDNVTLAAFIHLFKTAAKQCTFNHDTVAICILLRDFEMNPSPQLKYMKRTLKHILKSSDWLKNFMQHTS